MPNIIFITGASSGIGKAAAKLFASKGWQVIALYAQRLQAGDEQFRKNIGTAFLG